MGLRDIDTHIALMLSGLDNSPATFEWLMELVLSGLNLKICLIYLDDVNVMK